MKGPHVDLIASMCSSNVAWHLRFVIDLPARLSFVIDMVGREDLPNAIALNSMLFNLARMIGPIVSGVLFTHVGHGESGQMAAGVCFLLNGFSFVAVLAALAWMEMPSLEGEGASSQSF